VPVALELGQQVREHGRQQPEDGPARRPDQRAGRATARRRRRVGQPQRGQRRIVARAPQAQQQLVRVRSRRDARLARRAQ